LDLDTDISFDNNLISILQDGKVALGKVTTIGYGAVSDLASGFYYPVLNGIANNSTVVGCLGTLIDWLSYFADILPRSAVGFIGVIENSCNQSFTFRIDGSDVQFIGNGDQHDPRYNYLKQEVSFLQLINKSIESKRYLGLPLNDQGCQYTLSVYASSDLENYYKSSKPAIFMVVALSIFLITSLLFLLYDRLVERRQRLVMHQAESSGAIVSSLFPAAYHERLLAAQPKQGNSKQGTSMTEGSKESRLQSFLNGTIGDNAGSDDEPIADLFPDCTVMFADISGFTQWSSNRDPGKVFCLLQSVFCQFDLIAKRLGVFKVETIGDCYMAVTGLPNPQPNHARLMARFANECLLQMRETTASLSDKLGVETSELKLRIGLHSGPVTAGILRGEKSRFQLFGDTVNTASRMESTGEKNCIQVSDVTAGLISQAGKGHWLLPRENLVEAKGKGQLQTYWLIYESGRSTISKSLGASSGGDDESNGEDVDVETNASTIQGCFSGEKICI
jgi:class 3 adenylate cyclase